MLVNMQDGELSKKYKWQILQDIFLPFREEEKSTLLKYQLSNHIA